MEVFFITGFPRSRTAWVANLMTAKDSFCFHESLMLCGMDFILMPHLFSKRSEQYIGNCCSSNLLFMDDIKKYFPEAKHVLIERSTGLDHIANRLDDIFEENVSGENVVEMAHRKMRDYQEIFNPLIIQYEKLNEISECKKLWEYCVPTSTFDEMRCKQLIDMKIELTESGLDKRRRLLCQS